MISNQTPMMSVPVRNILAIALLALIESVHVLIAASWISHLIPYPADPFVRELWPLHQKTLQPERELLLFQIFIVTNVGLLVAGLVFWKSKLDQADIGRSILRFACWDTFWAALAGFAFFKMVIYDKPGWAQMLFYFALAGSWAFKIFWPEVNKLIHRLNSLGHWTFARPMVRLWDGLVVGSMIVLGWIPDGTYAHALALTQDGINRLDSSTAAAAWAASTSLRPVVDFVSPYGLGWGQVWAKLAQALGGVDHGHIIQAAALLGIIYALGMYALLRAFIKNPVLAAACVWLAVKLQFFNASMAPFPWVNPSSAGLTHVLDVFIWLGIWQHMQRGTWTWLGLSCTLAGLSWSLSVFDGFVMTGLLAVYLISCKEHKFMAWILCVAVVSNAMAVGHDFWTGAFIRQSLEHMQLWWQGAGDLPWASALWSKQFFGFWAGFVVVGIFLTSMAAALHKRREYPQDRALLFVILVSGYGVITFGVFVMDSRVFGFYAYAAALVLVLGFWFERFLVPKSVYVRRLAIIFAAFISGAALLSNAVFLTYPHGFNQGPSGKVKALATAWDDTQADVQLIQRYIYPGQKAAVISSQATSLLMQSGRRPYYFHSPLVTSVPLTSNQFAGLRIKTEREMKKTLDQMTEDPPQFIFVEHVLYSGQWSEAYQPFMQSLNKILDLIRPQYEPVAQGRYLIMLKKRGS